MDTSHRVDSWSAMALCRHYFSLHVEEQPVEVQALGGASAELTVSWAVGVLADGDWEVLGAWPEAAAGPTYWRGVWEDVNDRGVEKVSWVCTADRNAHALYSTKMLPLFRRILIGRHASVNPEIGQIGSEARRAVREAASVRGARVALELLLPKLRNCGTGALVPDWPEVLSQFEAFYALRPQLRTVLRKGDEVVEYLSRTLSRAVVRRGTFASPEAATSFVASTLARAEQRLKFSELVELAPPERAAISVRVNVASPRLLVPGGCRS